MWGIKLDKADIMFSKYIRKRDGKCMRCKRSGTGKDGIEGLQASHYFGRRSEGTRFDPCNVDALCAGCHQYWGSDDKEGYRDFKIKQLGENGFKMLQVSWRTYHKKDRKLAYLIAKKLYESL